MAVFANDGNLLAEFECPHVKVFENNKVEYVLRRLDSWTVIERCSEL